MQIHELPIGNIEDANKLPFDTGTNSYSVSFSTICEKVVTKAYSALTTTVKTIVGSINELNSKLTMTQTTCQQVAAGTIRYNNVRKISGITFLTYSVTEATIAGTNGTVCLIPEGYRPRSQIICNITGNYNGTFGIYTVVINPDGNVRTLTGSSTFSVVYLYNITYPVG